MRIRIFQPPDGTSNFGDALNPLIFDAFLGPETAKLLPDTLLLGIGTFLNSDLPHEKKVIVCGTGAGYGDPPKTHKGWTISFVRGPLTAKRLGLPDWLAVTDPAILVAKLAKRSAQRYKFGFMPRWDTAAIPDLEEQCTSIGIHFIDPRKPVTEVISDISEAETLITEALHGAIVADALRIPWIPVRYFKGHEFKWDDWRESMGLQLVPMPDITEMPLEWVAEDGLPRLSDDAVFAHRLDEVYNRVMTLRDVIHSGVLE